jgi:hypothetical protein
MAMVLFLIFMISSTIKPYGFFIDELYFIACSKRLAWGYIDQPPLSIALLAIVRSIFGDNMFAIRFLPALSISATAFVTGLLARRLGGGLASMLLASLAVMVMPVFLLFGAFYSMNAYEPLIWTTVVFFAVKMVQQENPRYWLHIGILMGLGLEMKHTIILYGIAFVIGLIISDKRRLIFNRLTLWGGLACFLIILPNLLWQYSHHFPSLELYRNSFTAKNIDKSYLQVMIEQVIFVNPFTFPLWLTGLVALFFRKAKPYRFMLFAFAFLLLIILAGRSSRPDRIASIYTFFMASGVVAIEQYLASSRRRFAQISAAILILAGGIILAPVFIPLMPPQTLKPYISRLGLHFDIEAGKIGEPVPQWLADRIGWQELAADVVKVYEALPEREKRNVVIVSTNYGEAGALELYGDQFGLPDVYATHNSFHSWGPPPDSVRTYIGVYIDPDDVKDKFESVEEVAVFHCPDCTRPQQNISIYVMRGPKFSMAKEWAGFKVFH